MSKQKVLAKLDTILPKSGGTMTGVLTLKSDPQNNLEAATKQYVDSFSKYLVLDSSGNVTGIKIKDQSDNNTYIVCMKNGTLASSSATNFISVTSAPAKMTYCDGDGIDTTGMVVTATCNDDSTREVSNYSCSNEVTKNNAVFNITYTEGDTTFSTGLPVTVTDFDPATELIDFEYTDNGDGTYTLTKWKGTYKGELSTEMIIPNNSHIIVALT